MKTIKHESENFKDNNNFRQPKDSDKNRTCGTCKFVWKDPRYQVIFQCNHPSLKLKFQLKAQPDRKVCNKHADKESVD